MDGRGKTRAISIQLPAPLEAQSRIPFGGLDQAAKEALAVEARRLAKLSLGQVAEPLELTVYEAEGFTMSRDIPAHFTCADLEHGRAALKRLFNP